MHLVLCSAYFAVLLLLASYGLHRSHLVFTLLRFRKKLRETRPEIPTGNGELPSVTIQLPLFNEATVAVRLLEHVSRIDYPHDRYEIQVLDDSTDETGSLVRAAIRRLADEPATVDLDIVYIHRTDRTGYKAGALDAGLKVAKGDIVAIFDADFLPQPDFVRALVPHFFDPKVGMVQARWGHLNRDLSLLTRVQAH